MLNNLTRTVCIRKFPYPYEAMLSICSDLDETPDRETYFAIARFLNTDRQTPMGKGVGLEVGNTVYFDMPPGQFSYWNTDDTGRSMIHACIRSGHIDCLHSYGDHAARRAHAEKAIDALVRADCKLEVWVDHATAPTNFGSDIMYGQGDIRGAEAYHADLSCELGIRFVWMGRVTSVIGQDSQRSLRGLWNNADKAGSLQTIAKECAKGLLARMGSGKYAMHRNNVLMRKTSLRDGRTMHEFMRCNPHWKGVSSGDTADGIAEVLTPRVLDRLVERQAVCILYTHLGKIAGREVPFRPDTIEAFRRLADYYSSGKILVTTTSRLLKYNLALKELSGSSGVENGRFTVRLQTQRPRDLEGLGLTLYAPDPESTAVMVNDQEVGGLRINPPDSTGRRSVSFPWRKLEFPLV